MDCSTKANDLRLVVSLSTGKKPQCIPANTYRFFRACGFASDRASLLRHESHIKQIFSPVSHYRRAGRGCLPHAGACASKNGLTIFEIP